MPGSFPGTSRNQRESNFFQKPETVSDSEEMASEAKRQVWRLNFSYSDTTNTISGFRFSGGPLPCLCIHPLYVAISRSDAAEAFRSARCELSLLFLAAALIAFSCCSRRRRA